jgi:hypothetical protein
MTIKIPPKNILDKILNFFGKKREMIVPEEIDKIYEKYGPYVQVQAKEENFLWTLFRPRSE